MGSCLSPGIPKRTVGQVPPPRGIDAIDDLKDSQHDVVVSSTDGDAVHFTFRQLSKFTLNFRPDLVIGKGIHGTVFRGVIDSRTVAIKVRVHRFGLGPLEDKEWLREEVKYLGQLQHPNIVRLIGFCCENDHRSFVYEYMPSGSLDRHIYSSASKPLTWLQRMKVALGAAKGLAFIHNIERKIRFRDFKTSNILLDEELNAKLFGFGFSGDYAMNASDRTAGFSDDIYCCTGETEIYDLRICMETLIPE